MKLILIGGAQRSGTTLLQTLIANALESPILPEAHILCDILAAYKRAKGFGNKTRFFYATDRDLLDFFQDCADRHVADIVARTHPGSALVLKDPNFVQVEQEASVIFPEAASIVCLRDPRDIAASFLRIGQRQQTNGKPSKYQRRDLNFIAKKILASYAPLMDGGPPPRTLLIRYEDLVTAPRGTLESLARDTGLALSLSRIDDPEWLEADARHEASWTTELEGQGPKPTSVGAFKKLMRAQEVAFVEEICGPYMGWAGYEKLF
jgi:Sulfotransferase family